MVFLVKHYEWSNNMNYDALKKKKKSFLDQRLNENKK